ncbi:uncharacterized protein BP01DRAFT_405624 [Aspergillus saccharolyticus JOP 1030-1]|uniref:Protein kinase domain-containing protein n=1 Tax=Aspergillus saccharolyticus JOP 1030-1 TaxID=1450539 RepID=A0A318Z505_9EURO|nr:hypothetical protein BP01DRAFT_405624 [Aspergillus saccharolyticus JOP 1030-1]PYH42139.1 hypothetical protein BP01DRAFT_405624 [Aspergillus saccharolyticus JOP 1030-1]
MADQDTSSVPSSGSSNPFSKSSNPSTNSSQPERSTASCEEDFRFLSLADIKSEHHGFQNRAKWETCHIAFCATPSFLRRGEPNQGLRSRMSCHGHIARHGTLETVYIGIGIKYNDDPLETELLFVFDVPDSTTARTIVHQCVDVYKNQDWLQFLALLEPVREPLYEMVQGDCRLNNLEPDLPGPVRIHWEQLEAVVADVPVYALAEVDAFEEIARYKAYKVVIEGETYVYKLAQNTGMLRREVELLRTMHELREKEGCKLRTPELVGMIGMDSEYPGILTTYIPSPVSLSYLVECEPRVSRAERQKWYSQISETVRNLHENGYCWGDAKPDNVVIDADREAWVVDFDGGYTAGWVDEELANTVAGDLQGLERIHSYLKL